MFFPNFVASRNRRTDEFHTSKTQITAVHGTANSTVPNTESEKKKTNILINVVTILHCLDMCGEYFIIIRYVLGDAAPQPLSSSQDIGVGP